MAIYFNWSNADAVTELKKSLRAYSTWSDYPDWDDVVEDMVMYNESHFIEAVIDPTT